MLYRAYKHLWLALVGLAIFLSGCSPTTPEVESVSGHTMGTTYHISWVDTDSPVDPLLLQGEIDLRLGQVNRSMSTWKRSSEVSRFNRMQRVGGMEISSEFAKVLTEAKRLTDLTDGALDVTVGPLVNLWGFGPDGHIETAPSDEQIARVKATIGHDKLSMKGRWLFKTEPTLKVDLSSIAKGYGVDVVAEVLESRGIHNYLVEVGGELRVKGHKVQGQPWRVAIERPDPAGRDVFTVIEPGNMSVATSGDYRNFFEQDGVQFSHLIDPATGRPVAHHLVSATVITNSCMTADGLATALMVMGVEKGLALAERTGLAVMLIERADGQYQVHYSKAFNAYLESKEQAS
ncbi:MULTISPECIES: FAD:protein FMN transferase [Ferrimonas]|uniref:FAD:protein FMN transferase n=1 Tax=Ferrimonas TaxID=44011 RepID=UPI000555E26D|nr:MULTISPECIES: FAD:protein FMN transferase [Ferrimonas]USD36832.1 FAD:protein FMN transferase [Ferrimonas sp. SCSIO 43195]